MAFTKGENKDIEIVEEENTSEAESEETQEEKYYCPECGAEITLDMDHCPKCGVEMK